jgi:hypothetical protein
MTINQGVGFSATSTTPISGMGTAVPAKGAWRAQR